MPSGLTEGAFEHVTDVERFFDDDGSSSVSSWTDSDLSSSYSANSLATCFTPLGSLKDDALHPVVSSGGQQSAAAVADVNVSAFVPGAVGTVDPEQKTLVITGSLAGLNLRQVVCDAVDAAADMFCCCRIRFVLPRSTDGAVLHGLLYCGGFLVSDPTGGPDQIVVEMEC